MKRMNEWFSGLAEWMLLHIFGIKPEGVATMMVLGLLPRYLIDVLHKRNKTTARVLKVLVWEDLPIFLVGGMGFGLFLLITGALFLILMENWVGLILLLSLPPILYGIVWRPLLHGLKHYEGILMKFSEFVDRLNVHPGIAVSSSMFQAGVNNALLEMSLEILARQKLIEETNDSSWGEGRLGTLHSQFKEFYNLALTLGVELLPGDGYGPFFHPEPAKLHERMKQIAQQKNT